MPWRRAGVLAGVSYFVAGYGSAALDPTMPGPARFAWRLTSWVVCAAVFTMHLWHERFRLNQAPRALALHAAAAVALGAFLLAAAAGVHAMTVPSHAPYARFLAALVLWPLITGVPAFLVALLAGVLLARPRPRV